MSDRKLRIGVIGIGWYAGTSLVPKLRETGKAEVIAIARRSADRLALAQRELGHTVSLAYDRKRGAFNDYEEAAEGAYNAHFLLGLEEARRRIRAAYEEDHLISEILELLR